MFLEITRHSTISPKRTDKREAEEPRRSTAKARPKVSCGAPRRRRGAKEEHQGEAEEPRTAESEEGTKQYFIHLVYERGNTLDVSGTRAMVVGPLSTV